MKTIVITGSNSMIGRAVVEALQNRNLNIIQLFHKSDEHLSCDLVNQEETDRIFHYISSVGQISYVIHLAGYNGNIQFNLKNGADIYYQTTQMGLNLLKACSDYKVEKVVSVLASCSYPDGKDILEEKDLWGGEPNPTVRCHGLSKRTLHAYSRELAKQYGLKAVCAILNNSFGPWDSYDVNKTKVVGGFIKKFVDAKEQDLPSVTIWGTGSPLRELVYSKDAGRAIVETLFHYDDTETPINIASGLELTIMELSVLIADIVGYKGIILRDTTKVDGQMRKKLDLTRMNQHISFKVTPLTEALKETIEWYYEHRNNTSTPSSIPA